MFTYHYDAPRHISAESLEKVHAVAFAFSGYLELFIDAQHKSWIVRSQAPLDPTAWYRPQAMDQTMMSSVPSLDEPPTYWIQRPVVQGPQAHSIMISGSQLMSITRLPLETLWHDTFDGWLRIVLHGPAKRLRPQADAIIEIEIASNSRTIAAQVAHYLGAKVVTQPKTTLAYASELPRLVRPPISNAAYFPPRSSIVERIVNDERSLCSHVVVGGAVGSGKTNTLLNILDASLNLNSPGICVIDPFDNFRDWANKHSVTYLNVGNNPRELAYLNCNPLVCPMRMRFSSHLDLLSDLVACAVSGGGGSTLPFYVGKVLKVFFRDLWSLDKAGFDLLRSKTGADLQRSPHFRLPKDPLNHLANWWQSKREAIVHDIFAGNPSGDLGNLKHILQTRLSDLTDSFLSHFNYSVNRGLDALFNRRVVVSLQGCSPSEADLIMGTLSTYYVSAGLLNDATARLENLLLVDEAHRVMSKPKQGSTEFETIGELLGKYMSQAICELRSRGIGCVLADQDLTLLAEAAQSTTGIQLFHRSSGANIMKHLEILLAGVPVELHALPTGTAVCKFLADPITVEYIPLWKH